MRLKKQIKKILFFSRITEPILANLCLMHSLLNWIHVPVCTNKVPQLFPLRIIIFNALNLQSHKPNYNTQIILGIIQWKSLLFKLRTTPFLPNGDNSAYLQICLHIQIFTQVWFLLGNGLFLGDVAHEYLVSYLFANRHIFISLRQVD